MSTKLILQRKRSFLALAIGSLLLVVAGAFMYRAIGRERPTVRLCVGEEMLLKEQIVQAFHSEAAKYGLTVVLSPGTRGKDTLDGVIRGDYDAAIVFGGLDIEHPDVRQVACLRGEPLQLFVKPSIADQGLSGIVGKRVNVGPRNGETQITVQKVIKHMGIVAGVDFIEEHHDLREFLELKDADLPDAIFLSAGLPSAVGRMLVQKLNYKLLEIPFGEVLALQNPVVCDVTIPANTYGFRPPIPERPIHTVGCYTMIVANVNASPRAVYKLLEVFCESDFPRRIGKKPLDTTTMLNVRDYPLHHGAKEYFSRNDPWMSQKLMDQFGKLKEVFFSAMSALLVLWSWFRRRPKVGYQEFLAEATRLDVEACRAVREGKFDTSLRSQTLDAILQLKIDTLERHRVGELPGGQPLLDFTARVQQIRDSVAALPVSHVPHAIRAAG
jgi:TRAP-type uncharacterized transport system substrate-binding protein